MSNSKVRKETRFLTDKMAYELNLSTGQYNDVYEINYDFIAGVRYVMDDVLRGYEWALNRYYDYLDMRNDDLRWVLSSRQYNRFMRADYFYRPIYASGNRWHFRIYITYANRNHFYYPRPHHYHTYAGAHCRARHNHASYYRGRYKHASYDGSYRIRDARSYNAHRRSDFGSITMRPGSDRSPAPVTSRRQGRGDKTVTDRSSRTDSNGNRSNVGSRREGSRVRSSRTDGGRVRSRSANEVKGRNGNSGRSGRSADGNR